MIKVFLNTGEDFLINLDDEQKEIRLIYKWHEGVDPEALLRLKVDGKVMKVKASTINNMQFIPKEKKSLKQYEHEADTFAARFAWEFLHGGKA